MAEAGFKPGDKIVEVDGRKISRTAEVKEAFGRHYAGDTIPIAAVRGQQRIEREITLAQTLEPFQHGFLGVLPMRSNKEGVAIRYVYPESPAAQAGIAAGDTIVSLQGKPAASRIELLMQLGINEPGTEVELEVRHADAVRKLKVTLGGVPEELPPPELPPARKGQAVGRGEAAGRRRDAAEGAGVSQ